MDVYSLYINIPSNEGIKAVETTLKGKNLQTKVIISFLELTLTLNNFILNYTNFLQIKRCAMGTKNKMHANIRKHLPLDETNLVVVRGLIHQEVSTKVHQRGDLK